MRLTQLSSNESVVVVYVSEFFLGVELMRVSEVYKIIMLSESIVNRTCEMYKMITINIPITC